MLLPCGKAGKDCPTHVPSSPPVVASPSMAPTPCGKAGKEDCHHAGSSTSVSPSASSTNDDIGMTTMPPSAANTTSSSSLPPVTNVPEVTTRPPVNEIATTDAPSKTAIVPPPAPAPKSPPATTATTTPAPVPVPIGNVPAAPAAPLPDQLVPITTAPISQAPTYGWPTWAPTSMPISTIQSLQNEGTWFQSGQAYDVEMSQYRARSRVDGSDLGSGVRGRNDVGGGGENGYMDSSSKNGGSGRSLDCSTIVMMGGVMTCYLIMMTMMQQ